MLLNKHNISQLIIFIDSLAIVSESAELKLKLYELNELVKADEGNPRYEIGYVMDWIEDCLWLNKMKQVAVEVINAFGVLSDVWKSTALYLQKNI